MTSKILLMCDALGNMVDFELLPGQRHDTIGVRDLIESWTFDGFIADKAFDVNWIVEELDRRGAEAVISQHPNRKAPATSTRRSTNGATSSRTASES